MGKVRFSLSASLDGFIADPTDDINEVFAWMGSAMHHWREVEGDQINQVGAVIMGWRSFNQIGEDWRIVPDDTQPHWPVIVLHSQPREDVQLGKTHYSFETAGIERAIAKAQEIAGEKKNSCPSRGKLRPASLEGGSARRVPSAHSSCAAGFGGSPLRSSGKRADPPATSRHT
jgi:hypothetical protein